MNKTHIPPFMEAQVRRVYSACVSACANAARNGRSRPRNQRAGGRPRLCAQDVLRYGLPDHPHLEKLFASRSKLVRSIRRVQRLEQALSVMFASDPFDGSLVCVKKGKQDAQPINPAW